MLKYVLYAVLLLIVAGVVAGGVHLWRVAKRNKAEMSRYAESPREPLPDLGKVLVVYYSLSGNTRDIAARIQKQPAAPPQIKAAFLCLTGICLSSAFFSLKFQLQS